MPALYCVIGKNLENLQSWVDHQFWSADTAIVTANAVFSNFVELAKENANIVVFLETAAHAVEVAELAVNFWKVAVHETFSDYCAASSGNFHDIRFLT